MNQFKANKNQRTNYIYRDANGRKVIELKPGEDGVTAAHIAILHSEDDYVHNADKRDSYHGLLHIEQMGTDGDEISAEKLSGLIDESANPESIFIETLETAEKSGAFKTAWDKLSESQRELVIKKLLKRSNVDIAKEEGCTEAAVRNRLARIQKYFIKIRK